MSVRPATRTSKNQRLGASSGGDTPEHNPGVTVSAAHSPLRAVPAGSSLLSSNSTRIQSRERIRTIIAVLVMLLYFTFLCAMFYLNTITPLMGIYAEPGAAEHWVVTRVLPASTAYDMRIEPGAIVTLVDDVPAVLIPGMDVNDFAGALTLEVKQGNKAYLVTLPHESDNPLQRWTYAILGLIFIGVGSPVFIKARQRRAAVTFYIFCLSTAMCFATAIGAAFYMGWTLPVSFISLVAFACSFALFFLEFPVPVGKTLKQHNLFIFLVVAGGVALIANYVWTLLADSYHYDFVRTAMFIYMAGCVFAGVACILKTFLTERSPDIRQRLVLLLGGTIIAVAPACLLSIVPSLFGAPVVSVEISAIALGIMPLAFAYAITQHQLLGVRHFVRRGVVYLVMGSSVLLVFSIAASALGNVMPYGWERNEAGLIGFGFFVFLLAFFYSRLQGRVEHLVDRFIYHDAYDYKEALLQFSSQLASEQKLQVLSDQLVERTCRLMNLACGALLLVADPEGQSGHRTGPMHGYMGLTTVVLDDLDGDDTAGDAQADTPRIMAANSDGAQPVYLETYAVYGDGVQEFVVGLQDELSALGIDLHGPSATLHSIQMGTYADVGDGTTAKGNLPGDATTQDASKADVDMMRSFLGVPLWTRQRFVGVLCLAGKKTGERFTGDDLSLLSTLGSQAALAIYNAQLHEAREQALLDTIAALAHAIEAKDGYTIHHCEHMTGRAVALAHAMGLPRNEVENVRLGAILHDIGKIGIPDAVLNKPGKLTADEYEIIKEHAAIGARIVQSVGALQDVVPIVLHHQERYDGSGYPDGLSGADIPIGARIIGVVDTYGAMTEDRIYRKAPGHVKAMIELQRLAGKQFDPDVVHAFVRLLEQHPELSEPEGLPQPAEPEASIA